MRCVCLCKLPGGGTQPDKTAEPEFKVLKEMRGLTDHEIPSAWKVMCSQGWSSEHGNQRPTATPSMKSWNASRESRTP